MTMATHDVNGNATPNQLMGAKNSPRTDFTPEAAARDARIVELRRHRMGWEEIATDVGSTRPYVQKRYRLLMARIPQHSVDEHRAEELILIDDAVADLLKIARDEQGQNVSHRSRIEAWSTIRAWAERKAKLLGLDAPQQSITVDLVDDEIKKLSMEIEKLSIAQGDGHPG